MPPELFRGLIFESTCNSRQVYFSFATVSWIVHFGWFVIGIIDSHTSGFVGSDLLVKGNRQSEVNEMH